VLAEWRYTVTVVSDVAADTDREARRRALVSELKTIDPELTYFAATMLGNEQGWRLTFQSRFTGWPEGSGPHDGVELREAAPIQSDVMADLWDREGQGWIAATKPAHLVWFLRLGGNALIAEHLARAHFSAYVEPHEVVPNGAMGFITYEPHAREVKERAPTKKQRMRVLKRDGYRCQLCGERPSDNPHVTLHVHHIRPFGRGGLTIDENLITLCHTCHEGLEPHEELALFWLPGGHVDRALEEETTKAFRQGVAEYRRHVSPLFGALKSSS
jgi:hypothetical protein